MVREAGINSHIVMPKKRLPGRRVGINKWRGSSTLFVLALYCAPSWQCAAQEGAIINTYGEVGLLDMPSAEMRRDGQLGIAIGDIGKTQRYTLAFQAFPWLETAFRYSHTAPGFQNYDRSFGLKLRFLTEEDNFADVSLGIRDLLGTGVYSSEYLVATKQLDNFDFTLGIGWGRLADTALLINPARSLSSSFRSRGKVGSGGGKLNSGQFFRGETIGLFGGLVYRTPVEGLRLIAEYSSDKYKPEAAQSSKTFPVRSPLNFGLSYQLSPQFSLGAGWYYGSTYGLTISFGADPTTAEKSAVRLGAKSPEPTIRTEAQQRHALINYSSLKNIASQPAPADNSQRTNLYSEGLLNAEKNIRDLSVQSGVLIINAKREIYPKDQCNRYAKLVMSAHQTIRSVAVSDLQDRNGAITLCNIPDSPVAQIEFQKVMASALAQQGLTMEAVSANSTNVSLFYTNSRYSIESDAAGRVTRLLMKHAEPSVEVFHLFPLINGVPSQEITVGRGALEHAVEAPGSADELASTVIIDAAALKSAVLDDANMTSYPRFLWSASPFLSQNLFDPGKPVQFQLSANAGSKLIIAPGLIASAEISSTIWSDLDFTRPANSNLPHVRTDLLRYLDEGSTGISYLGVKYQSRISKEFFAQLDGGYLEDMFMGLGGQILWRPQQSRFSAGVQIYQVWKRDYDRLFGIQNYQVMTGHASVYYESPWYGMNFAVHAGRYLAGDAGATFEIKRRFATGVEIGFFATLTNVPFSKFGEGSFDKGVMLHFPLEWMLPIFNQSAYNLNLKSLTRDGGQRLIGDTSLYESTGRTSYGAIVQTLDNIANP